MTGNQNYKPTGIAGAILLSALVLLLGCANVHTMQTTPEGSITWILVEDPDEAKQYECCDNCGPNGTPKCRERLPRLEGERIVTLPREWPLTPIGGRLDKDPGNTTRLFTRWQNITDLTIESFVVTVDCMDENEMPSLHYRYYSSRFISQVAVRLKPGRKSPKWSYFYLDGYPKVSKARIMVTSVHFADGTTWQAPNEADAPKMTIQLPPPPKK